MGKARQRQKNKDHSNPISKPVKPPADPELARLRETSILPVVKQLQSPEVTQRSSAAIAIANLIEDDKTRKLLLRERVVQILLEQTITDSGLESKSAGWGILRNLALEEEADFSVHLYRQDILTPMSVIIQNVWQHPQLFVNATNMRCRSLRHSPHRHMASAHYRRTNKPYCGHLPPPFSPSSAPSLQPQMRSSPA
jgi:hypothetical protein